MSMEIHVTSFKIHVCPINEFLKVINDGMRYFRWKRKKYGVNIRKNALQPWKKQI